MLRVCIAVVLVTATYVIWNYFTDAGKEPEKAYRICSFEDAFGYALNCVETNRFTVFSVYGMNYKCVQYDVNNQKFKDLCGPFTILYNNPQLRRD